MSMGRPTLYSDELAEIIANNIKKGLNQEDSARQAGIHPSTLYEWVTTKPDFAEIIARAHSDFKESQLNAIRAGGLRAVIGKDGKPKTEGDWRANAWILERKYKEEFGPSVTIKIDEKDLEVLKAIGINSPAQAWLAFMEQVRRIAAEKANPPSLISDGSDIAK